MTSDFNAQKNEILTKLNDYMANFIDTHLQENFDPNKNMEEQLTDAVINDFTKIKSNMTYHDVQHNDASPAEITNAITNINNSTAHQKVQLILDSGADYAMLSKNNQIEHNKKKYVDNFKILPETKKILKQENIPKNQYQSMIYDDLSDLPESDMKKIKKKFLKNNNPIDFLKTNLVKSEDYTKDGFDNDEIMIEFNDDIENIPKNKKIKTHDKLYLAPLTKPSAKIYYDFKPNDDAVCEPHIFSSNIILKNQKKHNTYFNIDSSISKEFDFEKNINYMPSSVYLTGSPEHTLFHSGSYNSSMVDNHTPFYSTMIPIKYDIHTEVDGEIEINLLDIRKQFGMDLIDKCYIVFSKKVRIECVYLVCNNTIIIDKMQGDLLSVLDSLKFETDCNKSANVTEPSEYIIPIPFFFRKSSKALPLIALEESNICLKIKLNESSSHLQNIKLLVNAIYLGDIEKNKFRTSVHEYLITQWGMNYLKVNVPDILIKNGNETIIKNIKIPISSFLLGISQLFVLITSRDINYEFDIDGCVFSDNKPIAFIDKNINMHNYKKYKQTRQKNLYPIPFCYSPDSCELQPTGYFGIHKKELSIKLKLKISLSNIPEDIKIQIWGPRFNILRIINGTCNTAYAINNEPNPENNFLIDNDLLNQISIN